MATQPDLVSLIVDGHVHSQWSSYEVDSDLLTPADAWSVQLGLDAGSRVPSSIVSMAEIQVKIGADVVMTGRIDEIRHHVAKRSPWLMMSGRDGAAVLVDCSAPVFTAKEMTLEQVVAQIVRPLGIKKVRIAADSNEKTNKISVDPGITAWDALQQAAEANGLWPWFEPDGTLVVGGPDYTTDPVARLVMPLDGSAANLLTLEQTRAMPGHFSEVTVLGQAHGSAASLGANAIKAVAKDPSVAIYRPRVVVEGDVYNRSTARSRARKYVADGRLASMTLLATVKGHRTASGKLWTPGQRVHIKSEPHGLDAIYFLMARRFSGGRGRSTVTQLTLKEDGVWVLDAHHAAQTAAKKKKGKKLVPVVVDW